MKTEDIVYLDQFGELCLTAKAGNITINFGHETITLNKLFGPTCIEPLHICFEGNDWNVKNIINRLRKENRELKQQIKEKK